MSRASQRLRKVFERRYLMAFVLLALAATASFATSYRMSSLETDRASVVILATEQRALSQRVAFLVKAIDREQDPARADELRMELDTTIGRMHRAHSILAGGGRDGRHLRRFTEPLQGVYRSGYLPFNNKVLQFLENARVISATSPYTQAWVLAEPLRDEIVLSATNSMMQTHGLMVMILEAEAARDVSFSKSVDIASWIVILSMLAAVTLVIFRPMRKEITRAFEEVEGAQARATKAEHKAVTANQARGDFFQAASHELRTPLNAILGMSDVIKSKGTPEIDVEVDQIAAAGDHLLSLLNNILDAHRMTEDGLSTEQKPFRLHDTLSRVVDLARGLVEQKNLEFESDVDLPPGLVVDGDAARLEQILVNLLNNAAKFTNEGAVTLHAHVEGGNTEQANLFVAISDTGIGIPEDQISRVFDRYGATPATLSRNGGLGVGLAVAKELVELMGGSIDVQSEVGKGSKFVVNLPFAVDVDTIIASPIVEETIPEHHDEGVPISRRSFSVLIVDDNMANRMVAEALLKPLGAQAEMAVDGRQAVFKAEKKCFDIIFMDISMPVMDGIEATNMIRTMSGASRRTPIIALTAHVNAGEFESLRVHGFQDIITKPVRKETLARSLDRWLTVAPEEEVA